MTQMRGKVVKRTATEVVALAKSYVGDKRIHYHLEYPNGGTDPELPPYDKETGNCDCQGFVSAVEGFDRYQPNGRFPNTPSVHGGYINTDSTIEEAKRDGKWFTVLKDPVEGCIIVAHTFRKGLRRVIGHTGVVVDASEWAKKGLAGIQVVHCSPGNVNRPGNVSHSAVWKTSGLVWDGYPEVVFVQFNADYALSLKK